MKHVIPLTEQVLQTHGRQMLLILTPISLTTKESRLQSEALKNLVIKKSKLLAMMDGNTSTIFQCKIQISLLLSRSKSKNQDFRTEGVF